MSKYRKLNVQPSMEQRKIKRALTPTQLLSMKMVTMPFTGEWQAHVGVPERSGSWLIWGNSGNGKTRYALQLGKYLTEFGRVAYDSMEEGISESLKRAIQDTGLIGCKRFILLDKEPVEELKFRLSRPKSPNIIIMDSVQYSGLNYREYRSLRDSYPAKLFIFISHADGKEPAGRTAKSIRFDANVKVYISGYRAFAASRYGGGYPFTIWQEGAESIYGTLNSKQDE